MKLIIFIVCAVQFVHSTDRVLLSDVRTITLKADRMTTGRRSNPVPQLSCIGGSAQGKYRPPIVQCRNMGSDGREIQWECSAANMPVEYGFGELTVVCEGYDNPQDRYILAGSCGLEFKLELTEEGRRNAGQSSYYSGSQYGSNHYSSSSSGTSWLMIVVVGAIFYFVYKSWSQNQGDGGGRRGYRGGAGHHDGPGGSNPAGEGQAGPWSSSSSTRSSSSSGSSRNAGGGFWSGAAMGGALGYLFGGRNRGYGRNIGYGHRQPGYGSGFGSGYGSGFGGGRSFGGGGGAGGSYTSRGFGGTRNR
uniref:Store-operated calcium entry-associated regulatory factor n=1 Tax=Hirondellea gigas TaxID=1518452 RepID=A0A6A7G3G2_9CRUS